MLSADRRKRIMTLLTEQGSVRVNELSRVLDVSEMTVHRDLNRLAVQGRLRKVRGGAVLPSIGEPSALEQTCCMCHASHRSRISMVLHLADGAQRCACCPHCGLLAMAETGSQVVSALATDFLFGRTINARSASYLVASDISLCCTPTVLTFERRDEAQRFQRGFGGRALDLADAMDYVAQEMRLDAR